MLSFGMPTLIEVPELEEAARLCRELGLQFIELNMSFPQNQLERLDADTLLRLSERYGIFYTIHLDESLDPASPNRAIGKVYTQNVLDTVALAKKVGIPSLNMHLSRGIRVTLPDKVVYIYNEYPQAYFAALGEFRDRVTEAVGESGVRVVVENTDGYDQPFLRDSLDFLLESPAFGLCIDIGHDHCIGGIDEPVILSHGERLCHMHMHDARGKNPHLALGDGDIDLEHFLRMAEEHRCRVVLETKTVAALRQSARYIHDRQSRRAR